MLLMSNILLWENVASVPRHASGAGHGEMSLHGLLDHAIILAHNVTELIAEMNSVFVSTSFWLSDKRGLQARYCRALHATADLNDIYHP